MGEAALRVTPQPIRRATMTQAEIEENHAELRKIGMRKDPRIRKVKPVNAETILQGTPTNEQVSKAGQSIWLKG